MPGKETTREEAIAAGLAKPPAEWSYSRDSDAAYIRVRPGSVARTEELAEGVIVDLDAAGHILGIELLDVRKHLGGVWVGPVVTSGTVTVPFGQTVAL